MKILVSILLAGAVVASGSVSAADAARGKQQFQYWCATCHAPDPREDGMLLPGTETLKNRFQGAKPAALEQRDDLLPVYVEYIIRRGLHAMPQFRKTEVSDQDMHDIAAYLDKSGGKKRADAGNFLQPYFGNTFVSHHSDGTEFRVLYSANGQFVLTRSGGPDRSAGYTMSGTYTIEGSQVCFHSEAPPPPGAFSCVPQDQGHKAGDTWEVPAGDGTRATHSIIAGVVARDTGKY